MKLFAQDFQHCVYCLKLAQKRPLAGRLYIYGSPEYIHPGFISAFVPDAAPAPRRLEQAAGDAGSRPATAGIQPLVIPAKAGIQWFIQ